MRTLIVLFVLALAGDVLYRVTRPPAAIPKPLATKVAAYDSSKMASVRERELLRREVDSLNRVAKEWKASAISYTAQAKHYQNAADSLATLAGAQAEDAEKMVNGADDRQQYWEQAFQVRTMQAKALVAAKADLDAAFEHQQEATTLATQRAVSAEARLAVADALIKDLRFAIEHPKRCKIGPIPCPSRVQTGIGSAIAAILLF